MDYKQTALFIGHRFLMTIFLLITIPTVVFFLLEAAPDNPFELDPAADEESLSARYIDWLGDSLIGRDFGDSQVMRRSAYDSFTERVNASLDILIGALLLSFLFGLPLGVLAAAFPRNIPDVLARYGLLILVALPIFWVGMMLILELGINRDWLPLGNRFPVGFALGEEVPLSERIKHLIMPVATMAIFWASAIAFMTRNFLVDFKAGHAERTNTILMGLPLAVLATLPVVVAGMMSSLVLVETIFSWPGFGRLLFSSVSQLDYPVMSAIIVMVTVYTTLIYFLCMVMYAMVCMIFRITANGFAVSGQFPLQAIAEQQTLESPQPARTVIPSIVGIIVAGIALFVLLGIVVAVSTSDADPNETSLQDRLLPRGSEGYPLGTDDLGRDVQARLLAGGRTSLNIAFTAAGISVAIGIVLGVIGGAIDGLPGHILNVPLNWLMLPFNIVPMFMILLLAMAIADPSNGAIIWAMALLGWTNIPPLVRARLRNIRRRKLYVMPESDDELPFTQTPLWNVLISPALMLVYFFAVNTAFFLLTESALSLLGMGVRPPQPSWGSMLANSQQFLHVNADLTIVPGVAIAITVACLMVIAENIRRTFDFTG